MSIIPLYYDLEIKPNFANGDLQYMRENIPGDIFIIPNNRIRVRDLYQWHNYDQFWDEFSTIAEMLTKECSQRYHVTGGILCWLGDQQSASDPVKFTIKKGKVKVVKNVVLKAVRVRPGRRLNKIYNESIETKKNRRKHRHAEVPDVVEDVIEEAPRKRRRKHKKTDIEQIIAEEEAEPINDDFDDLFMSHSAPSTSALESSTETTRESSPEPHINFQKAKEANKSKFAALTDRLANEKQIPQPIKTPEASEPTKPLPKNFYNDILPKKKRGKKA